MSTSPVGPEDIRAAAEVHHELGPEYSDAVVASFLDKVEAEVAARVQARLAAASPAPAVPPARPLRWYRRRPLATGIVIGACAGGLLVGAAGVAGLVHASQVVIHQQTRAVPEPPFKAPGPVQRKVHVPRPLG
jgi:hypothetical protein